MVVNPGHDLSGMVSFGQTMIVLATVFCTGCPPDEAAIIISQATAGEMGGTEYTATVALFFTSLSLMVK